MIRGFNMTQYVEDSQNAEGLSPYKAVQLLLQKAIEQVAAAGTALNTGDKEARSEAVNSTVTILGVLQDSLDTDQGGDIADNLDALYDYMTRRLAGVALDESPHSLEEVQKLLSQIKSAWDAIEPEVEIV
jgi:flagellar protein FliS